MKAYVTGGTGFIGLKLISRLLEAGHEVTALVRNPSAFTVKHQNLEVHKGDITILENDFYIKDNTDVVFHLAGLIGYTKAQRQAMEKINVGGTANVLKACRNKNVKKLIHMSSVVAVGASSSPDKVLNEDSPFNLGKYNFGYFETKLKAEQIILEACKKNLIEASILNPSTIFGSGDAAKGSRKTHLKVAQGKFPFYPSGGTSIVGVEDVIDCLVAAIEKGRQGERYILSGDNITIKQLFTYIAEFAEVKPPGIYLPSLVLKSLGALGDFINMFGRSFPISSENAKIATLYHYFDNTKARQELGLKPQDAKIYIKQSVDWALKNKV